MTVKDIGSDGWVIQYICCGKRFDDPSIMSEHLQRVHNVNIEFTQFSQDKKKNDGDGFHEDIKVWHSFSFSFTRVKHFDYSRLH